MRMKTFHVLCMLLMLSLNSEVKAGCKTNGCSAPKGVPYKKFFAPACDKHDVCYQCGTDHGWTRNQCDTAFKHDMYELCKNSNKGILFKWGCKLAVPLYHIAVRWFGGKYWEDPAKSWCNTCPKSRGDPNKLLTE